MFARLREQMREFMTPRCGARFRAHHRRQQKHPAIMRTVIAVGLGMLLLAAGLAMLVLPGPGLLVALLGAAMIGGESMFVARLLDRSELWLRHTLARWRN